MHTEKNISLSLEYNTDALASTFTKLTNGLSTFHGTQGNTVRSEVFITEKEFHKLIDYVFVPYRNKLVEDFIRMATKEFSGRCRKDVMGYEDLICHTVTSPIIRKGKITEQGMFNRRDMIFECNKKQGHVDFCILLLPFRTYSPIKNYGVMPDAGELYTVMVLSALAIACKQVQITIKEIASNIAESYVNVVKQKSVNSQCEGTEQTKKTGLHKALELAKENHSSIVIIKNIRAFFRIGIEKEFISKGIDSGILFYLLAERNINPQTYLRLSEQPTITVTISAIRDVGRYPPFRNINEETLSDYGHIIDEFYSLIHKNEPYFKIVDYRQIIKKIDPKLVELKECIYKSKVNKFNAQFKNFREKIPSLTGRIHFLNTLSVYDTDKNISPLFEPLLLSMQHDTVKYYCEENEIEFGSFYIDFMRGIYQQTIDASREKLRVSVLANALHGAVEYCSAYEANTGSRNQEGFDDVKTLFPDALRMSIHRKDESLGQFSIFVSPSHERTPWHGTAVLRRKENHLSFDTELAVCISRLEYSPLLLNGRLNGATYQQPLMFIHHSLQKYFNGLTDEDSLLELNTLLHKGQC
ncbi:L-tyrosine/L-tryptophan isonitrile synthase family protein [Rahnella sp. WP5]|uniref:L-tyrosine/L-tryptophan isonitrile synthase family protein n=1 Tax=Rahnella sp. WP5 TaxID=1500266 RepID=UPI000569A8CC|nr:L-tyrosine/L-tryptophan isonitrile synthase family protein [Rahnella sp. WP5]